MATTQKKFLSWALAIIIPLAFMAYGLIMFWVPDSERVCLRYYGVSHEALGFFIILISIGMMKGFLSLLLGIKE